MTNYKIFIKVLNFSTITIINSAAFINYKEINYLFVSQLIFLNILECESGNFETHERHYKLNTDFIERKNNKIIIKLNEIEKTINTVSIDFYFIEDVKNVFLKIKHNLLRKEKLKKLEIINN